jgi:hypothetical protein
MKRKMDRVDRADARDRDYGHDWKDQQAFTRWKKDNSTLEIIMNAKAKGDVSALPMLLAKRDEDSEEGGEALDAIFVIIEKNPGNREILGLVPSAVMNLLSPTNMFSSAMLISAIAEANPQSWDCRRWQPEIIEAANAILGMGDSIDVKMTLQQLAVALGYIGTDMALPILTEMLHSEHCNVGGEMERDIEIAMERIHR